MKTEAIERPVEPSLQLAKETKTPKKENSLHIVHKNNPEKKPLLFEKDKVAQENATLDPSWFANYE